MVSLDGGLGSTALGCLTGEAVVGGLDFGDDVVLTGGEGFAFKDDVEGGDADEVEEGDDVEVGIVVLDDCFCCCCWGLMRFFRIDSNLSIILPISTSTAEISSNSSTVSSLDNNTSVELAGAMGGAGSTSGSSSSSCCCFSSLPGCNAAVPTLLPAGVVQGVGRNAGAPVGGLFDLSSDDLALLLTDLRESGLLESAGDDIADAVMGLMLVNPCESKNFPVVIG